MFYTLVTTTPNPSPTHFTLEPETLKEQKQQQQNTLASLEKHNSEGKLAFQWKQHKTDRRLWEPN
jgi:hypothetical protein